MCIIRKSLPAPAVRRLALGILMLLTGLTGTGLSVRAQDGGIDAQSAGTFGFTSSFYEVTDQESRPNTVSQNGLLGALITVTRYNGAKGKVLLDYFTIVPEEIDTNDLVTATPNRDYRVVTNTLVFDDYQMSASFLVTILDGPGTNAYKTFDVGIGNPRPAPDENPLEIVPVVDPFASEATVRIDKIYNESSREWVPTCPKPSASSARTIGCAKTHSRTKPSAT